MFYCLIEFRWIGHQQGPLQITGRRNGLDICRIGRLLNQAKALYTAEIVSQCKISTSVLLYFADLEEFYCFIVCKKAQFLRLCWLFIMRFFIKKKGRGKKQSTGEYAPNILGLNWLEGRIHSSTLNKTLEN